MSDYKTILSYEIFSGNYAVGNSRWYDGVSDQLFMLNQINVPVTQMQVFWYDIKKSLLRLVRKIHEMAFKANQSYQ